MLLGITKRGDCYLRSLVVHGARALVWSVRRKGRAPEEPFQKWIWKKLQNENKHVNRVTVAVANRLVRIMWAVLRHQTAYDPRLAAAEL